MRRRMYSLAVVQPDRTASVSTNERCVFGRETLRLVRSLSSRMGSVSAGWQELSSSASSAPRTTLAHEAPEGRRRGADSGLGILADALHGHGSGARAGADGRGVRALGVRGGGAGGDPVPG